MTRINSRLPGDLLARRLNDALQHAERVPRPGARDLPILAGLLHTCQFNRPQENVLAHARQILIDSGRIYTYGNATVYEVLDASPRRLETLSESGRCERHAASVVANLFVCQETSRNDSDGRQFPPPARLVELLLNSEPTIRALPRIETYATRPIFDSNFRFLDNGWHADVGVLVHGPEVEPYVRTPPAATGEALGRLPRHLRGLLGEFCFREDADVVNTVGALLSGLLSTHFRTLGKGLVLIDGNRPGVGKTLLARTIGVVLGGEDPRTLPLTPDEEELNKRTAAILKERYQPILIYDNAKTTSGAAISSPFIESNSMAPQITLRILGQSANVNLPNDMLWAITMNNTQTSPDLVSRGLPIRLHYEGDPAHRNFSEIGPIAYAMQHRSEILGELAGMVVRWNQLGRRRGQHDHRCRQWANLIGGILAANGLPEFLANRREVAEEFNSQLEDLAALAEAAVAVAAVDSGVAGLVVCRDQDDQIDAEDHACTRAGVRARDFENVFRRAQVMSSELERANQRSKTTRIGRFLGSNVGQQVRINVDDHQGTAILRYRSGRSNVTQYYFEVTWQAAADTTTATTMPTNTPSSEERCPASTLSSRSASDADPPSTDATRAAGTGREEDLSTANDGPEDDDHHGNNEEW